MASASRSAYHWSVSLLVLVVARREERGDGVLGRLSGGRRRGGLVRGAQLGRREVVRQPLPVVEVFRRHVLVPDDVADVGVAEDAAGGDVRRARPDREGLAALQQDDELVVADALAHGPRDDRVVVVEPRGLDGRLVLDLVVALRVVHDLHVRPGLDRLGERVGHRLVVELIEGGAKPHAVSREPDESHERFEQAAREPLHLLRPGILGVRLAIAELPSVGLRADHAAIEEDVVPDAVVGVVERLIALLLQGHVERHRRRVVELRVLHRAVHGNDAEQVAGARLGGVVGPEKALDRMLGGGDRGAGRQSLVLVLEALDPAHPVALDLVARQVELGALDRVTEQVLARWRLAVQGVPREDDHVRSRVGRRFQLGALHSRSHDASRCRPTVAVC